MSKPDKSKQYNHLRKNKWPFYTILCNISSSKVSNQNTASPEAVTLAINNLDLNPSDKATLLIDEADLEYDEDFETLVVDQNNIGN